MKGYQDCPFTVKTRESFVLEKKIGGRGVAFRVVSSIKGQLFNETPSVIGDKSGLLREHDEMVFMTRFYTQTKKTVNTENISGMFIVF